MNSNKKTLELQLKYLDKDIEEVERSIQSCRLNLQTYESVLAQLKADKQLIQSKLDN